MKANIYASIYVYMCPCKLVSKQESINAYVHKARKCHKQFAFERYKKTFMIETKE